MLLLGKLGMVKKLGPVLREIIPAAKGSQYTGSRNLGLTFLTFPLQARGRNKEKIELSVSLFSHVCTLTFHSS